MNRRYTEFSQLKISGEPKPPDYSEGVVTKMPAYSTAPWPGAGGPKGPGINKLGWPEPKISAKQDMPDDLHGRKSKIMPSQAKAEQILKDNSAQGHPLTKKQKGLFGMIAGGKRPSKVKGY